MRPDATSEMDGHQTGNEEALRWLAARNLLGPDASGESVSDYVELIDSHARLVLEARA